jgi:hypothetical protein
VMVARSSTGDPVQPLPPKPPDLPDRCVANLPRRSFKKRKGGTRDHHRVKELSMLRIPRLRFHPKHAAPSRKP